MNDGTYEAVIGLEVHAQLRTRSKAFCACPVEFGAVPNATVCPVCLGHPGALPVLNKNLVEYVLRMGAATGCAIRRRSTFARKNYFYPDLPKGYQISQHEDPICYNGAVEIETEGGVKRIGITRIHMEEDAGKSIHDLGADTLLDFNRCGVPLIEIVSEPDMRSAAEAVLYVKELRKILMALEICDGNMEEGSLRCDVNVSVRLQGETKFNPRTEVKNLNSFKSVENAIEYEIKRQCELYDAEAAAYSALAAVSTTGHFVAATGEVRTSRSKEEAHDYRYFPEPDLVPVEVSEEWIERVKQGIPELPLARKHRLAAQYGIPAYDAAILTEEKARADYFEEACGELVNKSPKMFKLVSNWITVNLFHILNERKINFNDFKGKVSPRNLAGLINIIYRGTISYTIAKEKVFPEMSTTGYDANTIIVDKELLQISDAAAIEKTVDEILAAHPEEVAKYRGGKNNLFGFFVGQVLGAMRGQANPKIVNEILKKKLGVSK